MRMSTISKNILTIAVAALALAAFIVLAEGVGGKSDAEKRLDALQSTSSTTEVVEETTTTSTTTFVIETTTSLVPPVTSPPAPTTTVKKTSGATTTTAKKTATTTTTAPPACPRANTPSPGPVHEISDNQSAFTLPGGSTSATPAASPTDQLSFLITATPRSGTTNTVDFKIRLENHTSRRIDFGNGIVIRITVTQSGAPDQTYDLSPQPAFKSMDSCEKDDLTASNATVLGSGSFTASAAVDLVWT